MLNQSVDSTPTPISSNQSWFAPHRIVLTIMWLVTTVAIITMLWLDVRDTGGHSAVVTIYKEAQVWF